jgi:hypothetical protein
LNRGQAYRLKNQKDEAVADFKKYLELEPNAADRAQVEQWITELQ